MSLTRFLLSMVAWTCCFCAVIGLFLWLGAVPVPDSLTPLWKYIPQMGQGLIGQVMFLSSVGFLSAAFGWLVSRPQQRRHSYRLNPTASYYRSLRRWRRAEIPLGPIDSVAR